MEFENGYKTAVNELQPSSELMNKLYKHEEKNIMKFSKKKMVVLAAVACLLIGSTAAAAGQIATYRSWSSPADAITSYEKAMEKAGENDIAASIPESLPNGYTFKSASIGSMEALDENGNAVGKAKQLDVRYSKEGEQELTLCVNPIFETASFEEGTTCKNINGIDVYRFDTTYKFVPVDYELTEEDKANIERPDYEISYGSDEVEIMRSNSVYFEMDGKCYDCFCWDGNMSDEEWYAIAEAIINK